VSPQGSDGGLVRARGRWGILLLGVLTLPGCGDEEQEPPTTFRAGTTSRGLQEAPVIDPGPSSERMLFSMGNPYEGNTGARREGQRLWGWYNCADCHGSLGGGGIGPPFADGATIYGADPASLFRSIAQGRPNGMPTYGDIVPEQQIWMLVTYAQALLRGEVDGEHRVERGIRIGEWEEGMLDAPRAAPPPGAGGGGR
jgi:cytochrome c oxidase cbb3-type subunit III